MRTPIVEGESGDGAIYNLVTDIGELVTSDIEFRVRSLAGDVVKFDVIINGVTQSYEYTSTSDTNDELFNFTAPVTITTEPIEFKIITTALSNSSSTPRFRLYETTFSIGSFLSSEGVEVTNLNSLEIFPNPVKDTFSLTKEVEYGSIFNFNGKRVAQFKNKYQDINISNLQSGIYLLQVEDKNGQKKELRLVKE